MRRAIVLIDHGSRNKAANRQLEAVAQALRRHLPERQVEIAHLELAPPDLASALERCASSGAREVVVAPWFLAAGRHGASDMKALLEEARARHPELDLRLAEPLGLHPGLLEALLARIHEAEARTRQE